ncbi:MAG: hypothetical protein OXG49_15730 [Chloroflexi bacterium]|nr:hypothetical protein [Chloroflexota bacterium]
MKSQGVHIVNYSAPRRRRRGLTCILWGLGAGFCLLVASLIVSGAVYAGWNTGLATARAESTVAAQDYARQQCDRIPSDLLGGSLRLAQSRLEHLAKLRQTPDCLPLMASTATVIFLLSASSPTPPATETATPFQPTAPPATDAPTRAPTATAPDGDISTDFDLDALLAEAQGALRLRDYPAAIDTLDAIISIDGDFQRESVQRLMMEALTAQALALYHSGRLSEAIVLTDRAEELGSIDELYHERYIALLYLAGQRYKTANPAEAVQNFSSLYYEFGLREYVNGPIATDLQEAHRHYAMALVLQGDHCSAQAQFEAALQLNPPISRVNLADLSARLKQSIETCQSQREEAASSAGGAAPATQPTATRAPVGYSG